jgi:hypothetical protein
VTKEQLPLNRSWNIFNAMKANELAVNLPAQEAEFLQAYATEHGTTVADVLTRYARRLQRTLRSAPHPDNLKFTGSVPASENVRESYRQHVIEKHR